MKEPQKSYTKAVLLSLALLLVHGFANAQCFPQVGNFTTCPTKFLSISSDNCSAANPFNIYYTITITVNQTGASYSAYPNNAVIESSSTSGTTLTYVLRRYATSGISFGITMNGSCSSNYASISIQ